MPHVPPTHTSLPSLPHPLRRAAKIISIVLKSLCPQLVEVPWTLFSSLAPGPLQHRQAGTVGVGLLRRSSTGINHSVPWFPFLECDPQHRHAALVRAGWTGTREHLVQGLALKLSASVKIII